LLFNIKNKMKKLFFIIIVVFLFCSCKPNKVVSEIPQSFEDAENWFDSIFSDLQLGNEGELINGEDTITVEVKKINQNYYFFRK
jgi:formate/nitrite transporter FocA (FNT family)